MGLCTIIYNYNFYEFRCNFNMRICAFLSTYMRNKYKHINSKHRIEQKVDAQAIIYINILISKGSLFCVLFYRDMLQFARKKNCKINETYSLVK